MRTDPGSTTSVIARRADWRNSPRPNPTRLTPQSLAGNPADEIVQCLTEGRHPAAYEVQAVAAKIWGDFQVGNPKIPWDDIQPGCKRHKGMIAAAREALGEGRGLSSCDQASAWRDE